MSCRIQKTIGAVVITALAIVIFWEVMANRSKRPFAPFELTAEAFGDFVPTASGWVVRRLPVRTDRTEPNILAFEMRRWNPESQRIFGSKVPNRVMARLVHGYNMPDCMRLKGYRVELISADGESALVNPQTQFWRLKAPGGNVEIWLTSMVTSDQFRETGLDTRAMPFPRIGTPVDSEWVSRGITLETLRHPVSALKMYLRERWNSSRCDLATFLRLRQPAWASEQILTVVVASLDPVGLTRSAELESIGLVSDAYSFFLSSLREWKARNRQEGNGAVEGAGK